MAVVPMAAIWTGRSAISASSSWPTILGQWMVTLFTGHDDAAAIWSAVKYWYGSATLGLLPDRLGRVDRYRVDVHQRVPTAGCVGQVVAGDLQCVGGLLDGHQARVRLRLGLRLGCGVGLVVVFHARAP